MGLGGRGYVFTLITTMMILIVLSLVLFYTQISSPSFEDASNRMSVDELHYFAGSLEKDAGRACAISGQRATAYAINHIILTNETFSGYKMKNCSRFNYYADGVEAALAELMVCGTLENAKKRSDARDIQKYMENNTIVSWVRRVDGNKTDLPYNVTVRFKNMTMALYDPWHYVILSEFDFTVDDLTGNNEYRGYGIPVTSVVAVSTLEDPMYHIHSGIPAALRLFRECDKTPTVNGSVLDGWVDDGCYHPAGSEYNSPSFFDRLEGNINLSSKFTERSRDVLARLGTTPDDIGLESMVNLNMLKEYNVSVNSNLSQVDYVYWNNQSSRCLVDGMTEHPDFRLDIEHAVKYGVEGLNCRVDVSNEGEHDVYTPDSMTVPVDTTITWIETAGLEHELYAIPNAWLGGRKLPAEGRFQWLFNETGEYDVFCIEHEGGFTLTVVDTVE